MKTFFITILAAVAFVSCKKEEPEEYIPVPAPTASFDFSKLSNGIVSFSNSSQNSTSFLWLFGDGSTSTEKNPEHLYAANDTYEVTLTSYNSEGVYDEQTKFVVVDNIEVEEPATTGTCLFWLATADYGEVTVYVNGSNVGTVTHYSTTGLSPDCGATGNVTIERPEGTYNCTATSTSGATWSFSIYITNGVCIKRQFT